jgi:GH15 family glucan-1,4-alpha-glucosidase
MTQTPSSKRQPLLRTGPRRRAPQLDEGLPRPAKIAEHAVVGNLRTMALISTTGTIDFMCWPEFDSPSVFASLLDPGGGEFSVAPDILDARVVQSYMPDSNVLVTRWMGDKSSVEVVDLMTVDDSDDNDCGFLLRQVRATRGTAKVKVRCEPKFDYARAKTTVHRGKGEVVFRGRKGQSMTLRSDANFEVSAGAAIGEFTLRPGQVLSLTLGDSGFERLSDETLADVVLCTNAYWQHWAAQSSYSGRWRGAVTRSALTLKMMTSRRHGSIVAAPTFGLPESSGGVRNWDYRASWIRDASFTVYSLTRLGYREEGTAFARWIADRAAQCREGILDVMYTVRGTAVPEERNLENFAGYEGARPVRIGNAAAGQLQLDIYGALLDAIYLNNKHGEAISHADWEGVRRVIHYVCKNWRKADAGIWELRGIVKEHLHSRLMCWVALDRAIRLAVKRSLPAPLSEWNAVRGEISADIWKTFWNKKAGHFVRAKGSVELDGAMLMMPLVRFVGATDPQWLATLDAIGMKLGDDVRIDEARCQFEKLLAYANHVGLYAEEFSPKAEFLGNFPQALTHLALISAAFFLDRAINTPHGQLWPA